jgi:SAM-dependent methyltransferase
MAAPATASRIDHSYSETYRGEQLGNRDIPRRGWPHTRAEACIYWAGKGERVLDIGCGNGEVLYNLRGSFRELHGTELAAGRAETARRSLEGLNASIVAGDVVDGLDFDRSYFDLIICADVLEHIMDVWTALTEIKRVLRPGGTVLITTPNVAAVRRRIQLATGRFPSTSAGDEGLALRHPSELLDGGHVHYFTFRMLERVIARSGFSNIRRHGFGRLGRIHDFKPSLLSSSCVCLAEAT